MSRKKVEEVKRLKTLKSEKQHENSEDDIKELKRKLSQLNREKEKLEGEISDERQRCIHLESEVDKLCTKEKEYLSKIKELENELSSLKVNNEELVNKSIRAEGDHKEDVNKFEAKKREYVTKVVFTVLSVVKERVEQGLSGSEEQQYMQDTDHIQEAVDKFMQPIYEKLGINNQLDISSEHSSGFEGTDENTSANKQFSKPKSPYISIPIRPPYTELNDASCDSGYFSGCSTPTNSYHTF
jgi:chromosome segregation ATPase